MAYAVQISDASDKTNYVLDVKPYVNRFHITIEDCVELSDSISITASIEDAKIIAEFILAEIKKMESNG
jgi:hypothetical protein